MTEDVYAVALPEQMAMAWRLGGKRRDEVMAWLNFHMRMKVMAQWINRFPVPEHVEIDADWLVSDSLHDVQQFKPSHDCDDCREGLAKAVDYLAQNPGQVMGLANIRYSEVWP